MPLELMCGNCYTPIAECDCDEPREVCAECYNVPVCCQCDTEETE